ncbi:hypothetical protein BpHYR1_045586 [Brachionus plicatilis]|uniref:Uncharacterized protein n=1 Tax=Brachionus plicatilis TaxID=10195 RepID=A0A3M7QQX2_BRAPC|nr:hypothetical protein BpHYR1_045586 [Brachionus plicatilis]
MNSQKEQLHELRWLHERSKIRLPTFQKSLQRLEWHVEVYDQMIKCSIKKSSVQKKPINNFSNLPVEIKQNYLTCHVKLEK